MDIEAVTQDLVQHFPKNTSSTAVPLVPMIVVPMFPRSASPQYVVSAQTPRVIGIHQTCRVLNVLHMNLT